MPTLITGAGMVGALAAARLIAERGERPVLYDVAFDMEGLAPRVALDRVDLVRGDVVDVPDLIRAIEDHGVERIIHTAAFHTSTVRERPYAGVRVNVMGTAAVLEAARLTGVKRVVFCSSTTVYMGLKTLPAEGVLKEDYALHAVTEHPSSLYAAMKLASEWMGHSYRSECGVDFVAVRFAGIFAPWGAVLSSPSRRLKGLIEAAVYGRPYRITTRDLNGGTDFVYAADAAQGAVKAALAPDPRSRVYNISMGKLYTVGEIVDIIERGAGRKVELEVVPGGAMSGYEEETCATDVSRARDELGYRVEFPMEAAVADYLQWLRANK